MPTILQLRRGTDSQNDGFIGAAGELTFDTTNNTIRAHDGATQGGHRLATIDDLSSVGVDSNQVANIVDSAYIQARQADIFRDSNFVTNIVDEVYIQARDRIRDSNFVVDIIDSAYINDRVVIPIAYGDSDVLLFVDSAYVAARSFDSADILNIIPDATYRGLRTYEFIAESDQTAFTGPDNNGNVLSFSASNVMVSLNGITLRSSDYTLASGNTVTLNIASTAGDEVTIFNVISGIGFDSVAVTDIIDSAYIRARQVDIFRDSSFILDATASAYVSATSNDIKAGNLTFEDDAVLKFGDNDNVSIHYSSVDASGKISQNDGNELRIAADTLNLMDLSGNQYINATSQGAINLKYSNNTKLKVENHGITVVGDVVPFYDSTYSLGTPTNKWKELWVSSNTIFVGGLSIGAGETGLSLSTIDSSGNALENLGVIDPKNLDNAINLDLDSTAQQLIDSFSKLKQRTARYIIQIGNDSSNKYHSTEILLMHNNTNVYMTEYAVLRTDSSLGEITADITGDTVRLLITPSYNNTSIKAKRLIIDA